MQIKSALCLVLLSMAISLISFSISFTLFRRQWKHFITHPQRFFRSTNGRFLHIVNELAADDTQATTAFLYLTEDEFSALSELAKKYSHSARLLLVPLATHPQNNPSFTPMSLTRVPHLMLDHRKPLPLQHYVLFIIQYVLQTTSVQC